MTAPSAGPAPDPLSTELDLHAALQVSLLRAFFGVAVLVCLAGIAYVVVAGAELPRPVQPLALLGYALLGGGSAWALRQPPQHSRRLLAPLVLGGLGLVGSVSAVSGWGLQAPGLLFSPLLVFLANALGSVRLARGGTLLALAVVLAQTLGDSGATLPAAMPPFAARLLMHLAAILTGAAMGHAVAALLRQHLQAAEAREQRFRTLLGIAASAYWETDAELRLRQVSRHDAVGRFVPLPGLAGLLPWDDPRMQFEDPADALRLRQDMAAGRPLHDIAFSGVSSRGRQRHYLASGAARTDGAGRFAGYWGVVRDVTDERAARAALAATEGRYQALFERIPTPLVLHQRGVVVDANPAAARALDYASAAEMLGHDLVAEHQAAPDQQQARARIEQALALPAGQALPARAQTLRTRSGRIIQVSTISVPATHAGAPAVLSMSIDETERLSSVQALARSQALLARVVSVNPDIITLTEADSGRFVMVNDSFCRLLGHEVAQAEGRTAIELGIWRDPADRTSLLQAIAEQGEVRDRLIHFVSRSGGVVPLLMSGVRFDSEGQRYLLLNGRDISETSRVRLEREAILANASVGIAFTRDSRFVLANAQFEQMFGWPAGGLVGQPGLAVWSNTAEYAALGREIGPVLQRGAAVDIERTGRRRDGSSFLVRVRAKAIDPLNTAGSGTIWITEDVTQARQAERDLAGARDAAEAASRAKSAFLANTSHELRTPLNGVLGLASLARQPGLAPERQRQYLDQIAESAELLAAIISDILDVAKIEAGKLLIESTPVDLQALLRTLQQGFAAQAERRGLGFEAVLAPDLPRWVQGDGLRLRQILDNFLHNALKFTASGSIRLVVLRQAGDLLRFEVHDSGAGIDAATQARLFAPFTQADESTTRRFGGTGLGLSICRDLAVLMGGSVGLSSQAGRGSCFHAVLPLPALADQAVPALAPSDDGARLRGARVLLVEDNSVNMMIGVALLEHWGLQVTEAGDGPQALAAVADAARAGWQYGAVLMDVQMPGMSGYETTQALRQTYGSAELPVIALTAAALVSERDHAAAIGMNDFLTKPIDPLRLRAALLRVLPDEPGRISPA